MTMSRTAARQMAGSAGPRGPVPADLAERLFERLYERYDLLLIEGTNVAVPKDGTIPVFTGTLTEIAWQISEHASRGGGAW
jgi:hypothetical protein